MGAIGAMLHCLASQQHGDYIATHFYSLSTEFLAIYSRSIIWHYIHVNVVLYR